MIRSFLLLSFFLSSSVGYSAILAEYLFDNTTGTTVLTSTDADAFSTASTFGSGAGFNLATTTPTGFTSNGLGLSDGIGDDLAGAITANDYFTFTLTADAGCELDLDQISFDVGNTLRGAEDYYLFSDVGGFAAGSQIDSALDIGVNGSATITTNLTAAAFQNLASIEFRVYADDRISNASGSSATFLDNITITGDTVCIPEPQALTLSFLGLLALLLIRQKRRLAEVI